MGCSQNFMSQQLLRGGLVWENALKEKGGLVVKIIAGLIKKIAMFIAFLSSLICMLSNPGSTKPITLSEGNRIVMEKGIVLQSWVPGSDSGERCIPADDLKALGFGPTYYESNMFNLGLHEAFPKTLWSLAQAPTGGGSSTSPPTGEEWMSSEQLAYTDKLISVCFGDEQAYSEEQVQNFKLWIEDFRARHSGVLLHTNQWCNQWTKEQMADYMRIAKPDLLTFDSYYFDISENATKDYELGRVLADAANSMRIPAMAGWDGTGTTPIPFGQYLLGYKTGSNAALTGLYEITESQKNAVANMTLTMGGKWLNLFRIIYGDVFLFYDSEVSRTHHFEEYAQLTAEIKNISPHLAKLQNTDVKVVRGSHDYYGFAIQNKRPKTVCDFSGFKKYNLTDIKVRNTGNENNGLNGDVYIGYFQTLPGAVFESGKQRDYFALCNALATGNGLLPGAQHGSCAETAQEITLCLCADMEKKLYYVNPQTGETEQAEMNGSIYTFTLGGGKMLVFFWE